MKRQGRGRDLTRDGRQKLVVCEEELSTQALVVGGRDFHSYTDEDCQTLAAARIEMYYGINSYSHHISPPPNNGAIFSSAPSSDLDLEAGETLSMASTSSYTAGV
jgi:hypothetical protein